MITKKEKVHLTIKSLLKNGINTYQSTQINNYIAQVNFIFLERGVNYIKATSMSKIYI